MTSPPDWLTVWRAAMVKTQANGDRHAEESLHALAGLVRALTEGVVGESELRQHYAELLAVHGIGQALQTARTIYTRRCAPIIQGAL